MNPGRLLLATILIGLAGAHGAAHAQDELTGMFRLTRTTTDILGPATAQSLNEVIMVDEELQWQVYVPENYDRNNPPGRIRIR
ncbi:MAG: hypothetical protein O2907_10160 [Proteobacteria bacterium]|nr:hypothetical protein [Pseudomonadota bacterium]MDA1064669.1 hypothetical protein [Pseudomonadota bacterium]